MIKLQEENYCENIIYRALLKLQTDNIYLHLPFQIPYTKWFFEARLQVLLFFGIKPNYLCHAPSKIDTLSLSEDGII